MKISVDIKLDVDKLTSERFLNAAPKNRWKMLDLICNTRPDLVTMSEPKMQEEEGSIDEAPTSKPS